VRRGTGRRTQRAGRAWPLLVAALVAVRPASAQETRLDDRLPPTVAARVSALVDSARAAGLPAEPLVQKALEGQAKGAPGYLIEAAARSLLHRLGVARAALAGRPSNDPQDAAELVVAADLLEYGASATALRALAGRRSSGSLGGPLVGFLFLLQRGVEEPEAVRLVSAMLDAGLPASAYAELQRLVDGDIQHGISPRGAAAARASALVRHGARLQGGGGAR